MKDYNDEFNAVYEQINKITNDYHVLSNDMIIANTVISVNSVIILGEDLKKKILNKNKYLSPNELLLISVRLEHIKSLLIDITQCYLKK